MGYGNRISIATINGPNIVTIAGDTEPLRQLAKLYTERGYFKRFVNVEVPYHSHYINYVLKNLFYYRNLSIKIS